MGGGEAYGALEVASIGEVNHEQSGMSGVLFAQTAVERTTQFRFSGLRHSAAVVPALLRPDVLLIIAPVDILEAAVLRAGLLHHDLAIDLPELSLQELHVFGTDRGGLLKQQHQAPPQLPGIVRAALPNR